MNNDNNLQRDWYMIKFGLLLNVMDKEIIEKISNEADRLGFYSINMGDHLEWDTFEPLTTLSYIAALTEKN